jgi:Concanavalin A-like lectin/glucanases superfamily
MAVFFNFSSSSNLGIVQPDIVLEQGTSGNSTVYSNGTSAYVSVDSYSTTFFPNDYNVNFGQYVSGSTPDTVSDIDANLFTVNATGSHTTNVVYYPSSFTLLNNTKRDFDWGITNSSFTDVSAHTSYRYMGGTSPNIPNMKVTKLHFRSNGAGIVAIALYTGGALDDPTNATKRTEAYNVAVVAGWNEIDVPDYSWESNAVTWIGWAHDSGVYYSTNSSYAGDFQSVRGRWNQDVPADADETASMPSNPASGSFSAYWYSVYAEYEVGSLENLTSNDGNFIRLGSYLSEVTDAVDPVDLDSSDVDTSPDKGFSTNIVYQQSGPDSQYDTLREEYFGTISYDYVDSNTSDVDLTQGAGIHSNFDAQKTGPDAVYDNLTEQKSGCVVSVEELAIDLSTASTSNTASLTEASNTSQVVPFATRYVPTAGGTIDNHRSTLVDLSISGSTVTASRSVTDSKQVNTSIYCVEFDSDINVYSGTFSISAGSYSGTASIGATVSLSKAFLVFYYQASGTGFEHRDNAVRGNITSSNQITFSRADNDGSISGHWWVVEDTESNWNVTHVDVSVSGTSNTGTFPSVVMEKTMVVGSYSGGQVDDIIDGGASIYLSSSTEVTVVRGGTDGSIDATIYLVEFLGETSVQRGDISYAGFQTSLTDPVSTVTLGNSMAWIPTGWINTGHCTSGGTGSSDNLDVMIRARLTSPTVITGERNNNGNNDAVLHWEVVEWEIVSSKLNLEEQWTDIPYYHQESELAIKTGTCNGSEPLLVQFWNSSSQWQNITTLSANSWNNVTIGSYLTSNTFTIRFIGGDETGDNVTDSWQIDTTLVRLLGSTGFEDAVDIDSSNIDSSNDKGTMTDFDNMKDISLGYSTLTETQSSIKLVGNDESWSAEGASSHTFQYNLQSEASNNRLLIVGVCWEDDTLTATANVSYNGVPMTVINNVKAGTGWSSFSGMWYMNETLLPSTTGDKLVNVTVSESITREIYVTVAEYTGVAQETPDDNATAYNNNAGNIAVTLTAADAGSLLVAVGGQGGTNSWANTVNLTNIETQIVTSSGGAIAHNTSIPSGDTVVGWNSLATREAIVGAVWSAAYYSTNYTLDQEVQWTDLVSDMPNEELCIYAGTTGAEDLKVEVWNTTASSWDQVLSDLTASSWNNISIASYLTSSNITLRFIGGTETGDSSQDTWQIDAALIHVWNSVPANYTLDLEYRWTNVDFTESNKELCIYGGTMDSENILVDVWYNSTWNNLFSDLNTGWNNISVNQYLNSSTFTIRYRDGTPANDVSYGEWEIDVALLHVWGETYTTEIELEGTSNLYKWTQLEWTTDTQFTNSSIRVEIQLYNYTSSSYQSTGSGYLNYTSGTADTDETKNQVITGSPEDFRNSTSGWKIKIKSEQNSPFDFSLDYIAYDVTYYDEYKTQTEYLFTDITDSQSPHLNFTALTYTSVDGVNITLQVWNYTTSSYPTSGQGYLTYVSSAYEEWLAGWDQRVILTLDSNDIDSALSDFPVLIYLSTSSGRNSDDVSFVFDELQNDANRKKIAVTTSDGVTQCYVEIEEWDDASEEAWLWVKVPLVNNTVDTDLYLYYDADQVDNTAYVGDPNSSPAEAVWGNNFRLVTHMRDDPDTSHIRDSTGYDNDGTKTGANEPIVTASGNVSEAQDFDGSDDYVNIGSDSSLDLRTSNFTIEAWIYPETQTTDWPTIYAVGTWEISLGIGQDTNTDKLETWVNDNDDYASDNDVTYNAWNYVVLSWNSTHYNFFMDGDPDGSRSGSAYPQTGTAYIGGIPPWENEDCFNGTIDELRVSNTSRSDAWVSASFESGVDDLVDFGSEVNSSDYFNQLDPQWLNISINPSSCINGKDAKIRVTAIYSTTQDYQNYVDFIRLLQDPIQKIHDYALRVKNLGVDTYNLRLVSLSETGLARLINCTILLNSTTQIQVIDGIITLDTGTWANIPGSGNQDIIIMTSSINQDIPSTFELELEARKDTTTVVTYYPIMTKVQ